MSSPPGDPLFDTVREAIASKWQAAAYEGDHGAWLSLVIGDVDVEVRAGTQNGTPFVRATAGVARCVPRTPDLIGFLNHKNRTAPQTGIGMQRENGEGDTVRVATTASSVLYFITAVGIRQAVETVAWPANILLAQGFLVEHGGSLSLSTLYRSFAGAARATSPDLERSFVQKADELDARAQVGAVGLIPEI